MRDMMLKCQKDMIQPHHTVPFISCSGTRTPGGHSNKKRQRACVPSGDRRFHQFADKADVRVGACRRARALVRHTPLHQCTCQLWQGWAQGVGSSHPPFATSTHTHTHAHTHTHTRTRARSLPTCGKMHAPSPPLPPPHIHTHTHKCIHAEIHACMLCTGTAGTASTAVGVHWVAAR